MSSARKAVRRLLPRRVRGMAGGQRKPSAPVAPPPPPKRRAPAPKRPDPLLRALERGASLEEAIVARTRALLDGGGVHRAQAVAESLRRGADTAPLGRLVAGITAYRRGYVALAWEELRGLPPETWGRHAPTEYVRAGLACAPEEAKERVRALADAEPPEVGAQEWYEVLAPILGSGDRALARELFAIFARRADASSWADAAMHRDWMRPWLEGPEATRNTGRRALAIFDYGHPERMRGSANIGDHVQSIAAMGHLVRHENLRLHGPPALMATLDRLRERTRSERRLTDVDAELDVRTVHRDASTFEAIGEDTWAIAFGWFMHALFRVRHDFPLHPNLRPIFVSFHCNKRDLLTPEAIAYLARYAPIGCRDWTTVYLLTSVGVPAFLSGCLTTTIDTVFPALPEPPSPDAPAAYVDMPEDSLPAHAVAYAHSNDRVRVRPFTENVEIALERLETYRRDHSEVVTSRLHCYLPLRSIGARTTFRPSNAADIRYDGLIGLDDAAFEAMRDALLDKLATVTRAIAQGRPEAEIYALWREINAADVAAAQERIRRPGTIGAPPPSPVRGSQPAAGPAHCVVAVRPQDERALMVLVASLRSHTSTPLHVWLLGEEGTEPLAERLDVACDWIPAGRTVAQLGELLPEDVERAVLLPLPAVADADVSELAALDLGGRPLAAATRPRTQDVSGFGAITAGARRLGDRPDAAAELRRIAYARHRFDFDAFSDDVVVLDLAALRRERIAAETRALRDAYGLSELEALYVLIGARRAELPARWCVAPTRSPVRGPGLLYWPDRVKPWDPELTPQRERWRAVDAALQTGGR